MGWMESPPIFSTASKTAPNVSQEMLKHHQPLPPHQLEQLCLPATITLHNPDIIMMHDLAKLLKVYVDDFMGLIQAPTMNDLIHFTRTILHGIHTIFPPPGEGKDPSDKPISLKKLQQGDRVWATRKELLGWLFDGVTNCMQLPQEKVTKIKTQLKTLLCHKHVHFGKLKKINGKLMHTTIAIPNGRGLLSLLISTLATKQNTPSYKDRETRLNQATHQAISDWITLLPMATEHPTPCHDLVPAPANFGGYCNASKHGAGGIWFSLNTKLPPIIWCVQFPKDVQHQVVSQTNP